MKIAVAGGRDYLPNREQTVVFGRLFRLLGGTVLLHGCCPARGSPLTDGVPVRMRGVGLLLLKWRYSTGRKRTKEERQMGRPRRVGPRIRGVEVLSPEMERERLKAAAFKDRRSVAAFLLYHGLKAADAILGPVDVGGDPQSGAAA